MHTALGKLLWILERAGGNLADKRNGNIECTMNGEPIAFQVREKSRLIRLQLPPGKKKGDYYYPRTELRPTGILVLSIKTCLPGNLRHEWSEKADKTLDDLVPEIAAVMISAGPLLVEERRQREERARLQREEDQRRYEQQQRRKADRNRWRRFLEHAGRHREAELARSFLAALKCEGLDPKLTVDGQPLGEWIRWAKDWIETHDTANRGPEWVFGDVAGVTNWTYNSD